MCFLIQKLDCIGFRLMRSNWLCTKRVNNLYSCLLSNEQQSSIYYILPKTCKYSTLNLVTAKPAYLTLYQRRNYCNEEVDQKLREVYRTTKMAVDALPFPRDRNPAAIYSNNELKLDHIEIFGFDYDYTLALYKPALHELIFKMATESLVKNYKYPTDLLHLEYDKEFTIRGLHYDIRKGLLLKIDAFHHVQLGTVYRGRQPVSDAEVRKLYGGTHVRMDEMSGFYGKGDIMYQFVDQFALPEMTLLAEMIEYLEARNMDYDPECVFQDIRRAVQELHASQQLHRAMLERLPMLLDYAKPVKSLLQRLDASNKKLFLITNSSEYFVNQGMQYIVGENWMELFDVIITDAYKPKFFYGNRPFRLFSAHDKGKSWDKVTSFKKGQIYLEGNLPDFQRLTGWYGEKVLYFGDHVYSDLADVAVKHGWRTAAIIPEVEHEILTMNKDLYKENIRWYISLQKLIEKTQRNANFVSSPVIREWVNECRNLKNTSKMVFNPFFGSVFRTHHNATYFSRRLSRFADIYMSSVVNLHNYPLTHTFYPRRQALPHEFELPLISPTQFIPTLAGENEII